MLDDSEREVQTTPPPNTFTVSHITKHRPSLLTPPPLITTATAATSVDPAAFDYLTVWVGYMGQDTWEPRSSFWDEWKVSVYWEERRQTVAERNGWGTKRAEEEEREEKERVVKKWREYWADELRRQKGGGGQRGTGGGGGQKRKKRGQPPVERKEPDNNENDSGLTEGGVLQEVEDGEAERAKVEQPAAKRRRTRSSAPSVRVNGGRFAKETSEASKAEEAIQVQEELAKDEQQTQETAQSATLTPPHTTVDTTAASTSTPQPVTSSRPPSPPPTPPPPSSPPRPQPILATTATDTASVVVPPPRLRSPPPAVSPPSPPPRRLTHSPVLAVTVPTSLLTSTSSLAPPHTASSAVASDDDTIPASSQLDDDDLALTPIAMTVSSSISFDRQATSESDVDEADSALNGRRTVRFSEQAVRIPLKSWEEKEEEDGKFEEGKAMDRVGEQRMQEENEEKEEEQVGTSADEQSPPPTRRPLLPRKSRDYLDRTLGKQATQTTNEDRRTAAHTHREERRKEKLERRNKLQHDTSVEQKEVSVLQSEQIDTAVAGAPAVQMAQEATMEAVAVAVALSVNGAQHHTVDGAVQPDDSVLSATAVITPQQADKDETEVDQGGVQPVKESLARSSLEPQPAAFQQQTPAADPVSDTSHYDEIEDDESDKQEEQEDGLYIVEAILDRRRRRGHNEYLIKWQEYSEESNSWEPEGNLSCDALVEEFEAQLNSKRTRDRERRGSRSRKGRETSCGGGQDKQLVDNEASAERTGTSSGAEVKAEQAKEVSSTQSAAVSLDDEKETTVQRENGSSSAKLDKPETVRSSVESKTRRLNTDTPKNGVRRDNNARAAAVRRLSATSNNASKRLSGVDCKSVEKKSVAECSLEELEYIARVKRREEVKVANREKRDRIKREMVAASQVSSVARPVRAMSNGSSETSGRTAAPLKPGLLKRVNGSAVGSDRGVERTERLDGRENGSVGRQVNVVIPRIPKMSRMVQMPNGSSFPTRTSGLSSASTSPPPPSMLRSPPPSPPMSPQSSPLSNVPSLPSALSSVPSASLVAQLTELNNTLATVPAIQRSSSLPVPAPFTSALVSTPPTSTSRSVSASDAAQPPAAAQSDNVLLMGDAALAFSLVLLDHRPANPTTITSALRPPSLTCPSTSFLSLLSCHPKLYCVPASSELTTLLPLSLTCGHLKGKRLYLRQDVDPLQLSDSFPTMRFGCVQLSLGSEGENTAGEVQLMGQLMASVAHVMSSEGVLRWTVTAQPSNDTKRTEDSMRQRGTAAGLQLVSVERTYLGSLQPSAVVDEVDAVHTREDREKVRSELTTFMGGETYVFARLTPPPPPQPPAPPAAATEERTEEMRRNEVLNRMRRERAEEQERERLLRDQRARDKFAAVVKQPSTESAAHNSHSYHQAPLHLPNHVPRFDADKARYSAQAQAFLQHRLGGGHGGMHFSGQQGYGSAFVQ